MMSPKPKQEMVMSPTDSETSLKKKISVIKEEKDELEDTLRDEVN